MLEASPDPGPFSRPKSPQRLVWETRGPRNLIRNCGGCLAVFVWRCEPDSFRHQVQFTASLQLLNARCEHGDSPSRGLAAHNYRMRFRTARTAATRP